jgi:hypothetical protein
MQIYYTKAHIDEAVARIKGKAKRLELDAAYGGERHDGGSSLLLGKLEVFTTVWDGKPLTPERIPNFMKSEVHTAYSKSQEDWDDYD